MYELLNFACVSLCTGKWCQPGLQYWVLVLVLDLYLSTIFKYLYWYLNDWVLATTLPETLTTAANSRGIVRETDGESERGWRLMRVGEWRGCSGWRHRHALRRAPHAAPRSRLHLTRWLLEACLQRVIWTELRSANSNVNTCWQLTEH